MSILAVSGDVGGARAMLSVLRHLSEIDEPFSIVENGLLSSDADEKWQRVPAVLEGQGSLESLFEKGHFKILIFTSSVKDVFALKLARLAKRKGLYVIFLLDNWMNYRNRLEMDGGQMFLPDKYLVMDELAFEEARKEGISVSSLRIVGQPAMASLGRDYEHWAAKSKDEVFDSFGLNKDKKLIAFISEPVEDDQGSGSECSQYRGYTEKSVLKEFCIRLEPFSDKYQIGLVAHPRENSARLYEHWQKFHGPLEGGLLEMGSGRDSVFLADGIAGMVSVLLYEAWLLNKPTISLQPNLCRQDLNFLQKRQGLHCLVDEIEWDSVLDVWMNEMARTDKPSSIRDELRLHMQSPVNIGNLLIDCLNENNVKEQLF
ncbi:MAG: hypothetical protein K8R02_09855 [Anaerohalosphaeraceae bacterium]|nr:hypothetical protein [Anaerohalosphaeraceae bacterium]